MLSIAHLREVRKLAIRKHVWYKVLDGLERGIINLTIKLVNHVKSPRLADTIAKIMLNLELALRSEYSRHLESYGYHKMRIIIDISIKLGYQEASSWASEAFARLLTLNNMYNAVRWRQLN